MSEFLLSACNCLLLLVCRMVIIHSGCHHVYRTILDPNLSCSPMAGSNFSVSFLPFGCPAVSWRPPVTSQNSQTICSCFELSSSLELFFLVSNLNVINIFSVFLFFFFMVIIFFFFQHEDIYSNLWNPNNIHGLFLHDAWESKVCNWWHPARADV